MAEGGGGWIKPAIRVTPSTGQIYKENGMTDEQLESMVEDATQQFAVSIKAGSPDAEVAPGFRTVC